MSATDRLTSGLTSVESMLTNRLGDLKAAINTVEHEIGALIQRRDRLYSERDNALAALAAIQDGADQ